MRNHPQKNLGIRVRLEMVGKIDSYTSNLLPDHQKVASYKCFLVHVGYLETCQCCVSLLLRSLSFHSSLSTLPTQEWQLCVGRTFTISTSMRSTRAVEKANLSAIPHHGREQWNTWLALLNDRFDRKVLQLL